MGENTRITIIAVLAAMALLIFTDVRAIHYDYDPSIRLTFGECELYLHNDATKIICDGLAGDNDGYDVPKLKGG